jgi:hypothetical protein
MMRSEFENRRVSRKIMQPRMTQVTRIKSASSAACGFSAASHAGILLGFGWDLDLRRALHAEVSLQYAGTGVVSFRKRPARKSSKP